MTDEYWSAYSSEVWQRLQTAKLSALYFAELKEKLSRRLRFLQYVSALSGAVSVVSALTAFFSGIGGPAWLMPLASFLCGSAAIWIDVAKLPSQVGTVTDLVGAWKERETFWKGTWLRMMNGHYPGDMEQLMAVEAPIAKTESDVPLDKKLRDRLINELEAATQKAITA